MTTKSEIRNWLHAGLEKKATHVLVVCDTYDWSDYPVFIMPGDDIHEKIDKNNGPNMTKLMEVYDLSMDLETQLQEQRAYHVPARG